MPGTTDASARSTADGVALPTNLRGAETIPTPARRKAGVSIVTETFVAEMVVAGRSSGSVAELAAPAKDWFGGPVRLMSLEVSLHEVDGLVRYVLTGRFEAVSTAKISRLEVVARWLGLVHPEPRGSILP